MTKITRHAVLSGTHDEYIAFLYELAKDSTDYIIRPDDLSEIDGKSFFHIRNYHSLQGRSGYYLVYVGAWAIHDTEDLMRIQDLYEIEKLSRA